MAFKMILVKAPALQKLMVLLLLTFSGLGYSPQLCDAMKVKQCYGCADDNPKSPSCDSPVEYECLPGWDTGGCVKYEGREGGKVSRFRTCAGQLGPIWKCLIEKIAGPGAVCTDITKESFDANMAECYKAAVTARSASQGNHTDSEGRQGQTTPIGTGLLCVCDGELCNDDALGTGTGGDGKGGVEPLSNGRKEVFGVVVILWATNWLSY